MKFTENLASFQKSKNFLRLVMFQEVEIKIDGSFTTPPGIRTVDVVTPQSQLKLQTEGESPAAAASRSNRCLIVSGCGGRPSAKVNIVAGADTALWVSTDE